MHSYNYEIEKDIYRITIFDYIGNELFPGSIVTYAAGSKLKFGVYEGVVKKVLTKQSLNKNKAIFTSYRVQLCAYRKNKIRRTILGNIEYYPETDSYSVPQNIVAIRNPLYHFENNDITACLDVILKLKDEGHLPKDFKII